MNKIWELAVAHDVPVGVHVSGPGARLPSYVAGFGNPLRLEPVLKKFPDLRLYLMHAGWPFLEETVTMLRQYPNLYVDISFIDWQMPRRLFYDHLEGPILYGFEKRIMFGTDQNWPDVIEVAVAEIEEAPFLTAGQRRLDGDPWDASRRRVRGLSDVENPRAPRRTPRYDFDP